MHKDLTNSTDGSDMKIEEGRFVAVRVLLQLTGLGVGGVAEGVAFPVGVAAAQHLVADDDTGGSLGVALRGVASGEDVLPLTAPI